MPKTRCAECGAWLNCIPESLDGKVYGCIQCGNPQWIDEGPDRD